MKEIAEKKGYGQGKRPLWQWIALYAIAGAGVYGLIYYFVFAKNGYRYQQTPIKQQMSTQPSQAIPTSSGMQQQNTVTLTQTGFSPATITIKIGQSVTWTNNSKQDATVNSNPHPVHTGYMPLNLGLFSDGTSLSLTFPKAGTYGYHNHLNPTETGTIIVQ